MMICSTNLLKIIIRTILTFGNQICSITPWISLGNAGLDSQVTNSSQPDPRRIVAKQFTYAANLGKLHSYPQELIHGNDLQLVSGNSWILQYMMKSDRRSPDTIPLQGYISTKNFVVGK